MQIFIFENESNWPESVSWKKQVETAFVIFDFQKIGKTIIFSKKEGFDDISSTCHSTENKNYFIRPILTFPVKDT